MQSSKRGSKQLKTRLKAKKEPRESDKSVDKIGEQQNNGWVGKIRRDFKQIFRVYFKVIKIWFTTHFVALSFLFPTAYKLGT
jgi:hypothetical protein